MTLHIPVPVAHLAAYLAAWSQAHLPGASRPILAGGAVAAGWLVGKAGAQVVAWAARVALFGFGCLLGYVLLKG